MCYVVTFTAVLREKYKLKRVELCDWLISFQSSPALAMLSTVLKTSKRKAVQALAATAMAGKKIPRQLQCLVLLFDCTHDKLNIYKQTFMCLYVTIPKSILNSTVTQLIPLSTPICPPQKLNSFKSIKFSTANKFQEPNK